MSCSASLGESWTTLSSRQTSITGWRDWYTHTHTAPPFLPHVPSVKVLCCLLTWFWSLLQVAVLLHVGGSGEHLYLLGHLLCCPAGVGKWAAPFLQVSWRHHLVSSWRWLYRVTGVVLPMSASDPSVGERLRSAALYASSGHPNVALRVNIRDPEAPDH